MLLIDLCTWIKEPSLLGNVSFISWPFFCPEWDVPSSSHDAWANPTGHRQPFRKLKLRKQISRLLWLFFYIIFFVILSFLEATVSCRSSQNTKQLSTQCFVQFLALCPLFKVKILQWLHFLKTLMLFWLEEWTRFDGCMSKVW